ncbi:2-oxoglutarate dehydrogenase E1 subunit family protein, partial [Candidatus Protofrankia californiensis]|uniref:2-oxoglutarate dehydrogenase E1 subunit family protein n=1 Tax=Candidatus Protofrankia californiensis TaxID=1839754 RepID=UPI0013EE2921
MTAPTVPESGPDFGPNEWLVFEIYQQYLADPESVSPEWREFLSDYQPEGVNDRPGAKVPVPPAVAKGAVPAPSRAGDTPAGGPASSAANISV